MTKFWTPKTEKTTIAVGMALAGYSVISATFCGLPKLPAMLTNPVLSNISVVTIAAGLTLYGVFVLMTKY